MGSLSTYIIRGMENMKPVIFNVKVEHKTDGWHLINRVDYAKHPTVVDVYHCGDYREMLRFSKMWMQNIRITYGENVKFKN